MHLKSKDTSKEFYVIDNFSGELGLLVNMMSSKNHTSGYFLKKL